MGYPIYIRDLPLTDIDAGHVTLAVGGMEFVATVALYCSFLDRECARMREWSEANRHQGAEIFRLRSDDAH